MSHKHNNKALHLSGNSPGMRANGRYINKVHQRYNLINLYNKNTTLYTIARSNAILHAKFRQESYTVAYLNKTET